MNVVSQPLFRIALARTPDDLRAAQALRYRVFVEELGAGGSMVDHDARLEQDRYDEICDHMLLYDDAIGAVVGVYRLILPEHADKAGQFYSADEYDLGPLMRSGRRLLELGRSCLRADYRGGTAMYHLWNGLADYVRENDVALMFGVASFPGTDADALAQPLSLLHHRHLAPEGLRPTVKGPAGVDMNRMPEKAIDRRRAMVQIPALIKAYLRLGGLVGEGAFVDRTFNTTDICLMLDTAAMNARQKQIYATRR